MNLTDLLAERDRLIQVIKGMVGMNCFYDDIKPFDRRLNEIEAEITNRNRSEKE